MKNENYNIGYLYLIKLKGIDIKNLNIELDNKKYRTKT